VNAVDTIVSERLRLQPNELPATARDGHTPVACGRYQPPRSGWIVCQTHPQSERWAHQNLTRLGYRVYLPLYVCRVRDRVLRTMTRIVERPLFTGYVFTALTDADPWTPVRYCPGVRAILGLSEAGKPQYARAGAVDALRALDASRLLPMRPDASWPPGTPCSLRKGHPFEGHEAVVISSGHEMALVSMVCFGQLREITVSLDALAPRGDG
jgi:transcription antitermination factor NusG